MATQIDSLRRTINLVQCVNVTVWTKKHDQWTVKYCKMLQ